MAACRPGVKQASSEAVLQTQPTRLVPRSEVPPLGPDANALLDRLATGFTVEEAGEVKVVERTTNHDVKAIEYVLKDKFAADPELAKVGGWAGAL